MKSSSKTSLASPHNPSLSPSHLDFPVVGIGASAGGLEAVQAFFQHAPENCGMAFVVVLHLSPDHQSQADRLIQRVTRMPVCQVSEPVPIERDHVYVISPANRLSTNDGYLRVSPARRSRGDHVAIDLFFRDLADVHKDHAFCVILSGSGSDGAVGLSRIKEQGGVTLVQSPDDAQYPDMPKAAIATGMVDLILPVTEIPGKLLELWRSAKKVKLPEVGFAGRPTPLSASCPPPSVFLRPALQPCPPAKASCPAPLQGATIIAFSRGCSFRRILESWLQTCEIVPTRVLELASYHAIAVCVAAGTGVAIMPQSVLKAVNVESLVRSLPLPPKVARVRTHLVWRNGHESRVLQSVRDELARHRRAS